MKRLQVLDRDTDDVAIAKYAVDQNSERLQNAAAKEVMMSLA